MIASRKQHFHFPYFILIWKVATKISLVKKYWADCQLCKNKVELKWRFLNANIWIWLRHCSSWAELLTNVLV
ncbi:unnamed protein product [Blepharisma stoltei]|uniref:Uncharacterized protein n=1 Tax=Blepharisma stoltei TaxID=1481888 RepID=A0AAU9IL48_9CILI|nr:unnamed protein product [Blepharisma stoltei]